MSSKKKRSHKDFIDYEPKFVIYIDKSQMKLIEKFRRIIKALRGKNMTVKEIHDLYYDEENKKHKLTIKTIYRYLDELEDAGLVSVAGHRVTKGSRVFEKLYTRTALIFNMKMDEDYKKSKKEYYSNLSEKMFKVLSEMYEKPDIDYSKFKEVILEFFLSTKMNIEKIMDVVKENQALIELYSKLDIDTINTLDYNIATFITLLTNPEILETMQELLL